MPGTELSTKQIAFLDRFILKGWFTGSKNKKTTDAYTRYVEVEQTFKDALLALPGDDPRVKELGGRAAGPMAKKNAGDFDGAREVLAALIPLVGQLRQTITSEHAKAVTSEHTQAVTQFDTVLADLPDADPRVKSIVARADGPKTAAPADMPAAMDALKQLGDEAAELGPVMVEEHAEAVRQFQQAIKVLPADDSRIKLILDKSVDPIGRTTARESFAAIKTLTDLKTEIEQAKQDIAADKTRMLQRITQLADPGGASPDEKEAMEAERNRVTAAMAADWPTPDDFAKAQLACDALAKLVRTSEKLSALATKSPQAAAKAREVVASFDAIIGDRPVTAEWIAEIEEDIEEARKHASDAILEWNKANALPGDTPQQVKAKELAIEAALADYQAAQNKEEAARKINNAIIGKEKLSQSLAFGPLAPDAGRPFNDGSAEKLIAAYQKDPLLADSAAALAQRSRDPDQIAHVIEPMCNLAASGFAANGMDMRDDRARSYAENLLKSGDHIGPDFYDGLNSYLESGRQFEENPLGPLPKTFSELATTRSKAIGGAMLADDGTFDPTSDKARNAINDLMYHPGILRNATPSLALHAFETQKALQDAKTKKACAKVINGMKAPTGQAGTGLVCKTLGVGPPITDADARQAALAAFFTPMDQGPVGSCFTTAPARRFRHENPAEALKGFAEIASQGTFTSAGGLKVPAVTKLNDGGNPLVQSWEFSVASAAATQTGSRERKALRGNLLAPDGLGKVIETVGGTDKRKQEAARAKLTTAIATDFNFYYDPTSEITDSNDGSSSKGRYRIQPVDDFGAPRGGPITTKEEFIKELTDSALKALSVSKTSDEGKAIIAHIQSNTFIDAVCRGKYKPWELSSGGLERDPTKALFGGDPQTKTLVTKVSNPKAPPNEGARTKEVLTALVDMVTGSTDRFINIGTSGIHSFNALPTAKSRPGEHSMQDLHGSTPSRTARNIQRKVIDPGKKISDTALSVERAAHMFDKKINAMLANETDDALRQELERDAEPHRPTADAKPEAILAAVTKATKEFDKKRARRTADKWKAEQETPQDRVDTWKREQEKTGVTVSDTELADKLRAEQLAARDAYDKKLADMEKAYARRTNNSLLSELANNLGSPQVMVADTNWGDERTHTFFVAMPDPTTGELRLWKRTEPGGDLAPLDRKWIDTEWDRTE
ncbi:hypothetical protein AB9K34_23665 [Sedimentitalea sp. XS_ASV28]|uniref:hypothetical protein n=1 Tax=Sedimentitalea sp. XS_ASV28 TaxID=3241296 RepID=UPI00351349D3